MGSCYSFAAAHLPYRFVEQEVLRNFAQGFIELGASRGCIPASEFIIGQLTVLLAIPEIQPVGSQCGLSCK